MKQTRQRRNINKKVVRITIGSILLLICISVLTFILVFQVKSVEVMGNTRYTEKEMKEMVLKGPFAGNSLIISWLKGNQKTQDIPFVNSVKVERISNHKIRLIVNEKQIIGYLKYQDSLMYFDKDGYVVESGKAVEKKEETVDSIEESVQEGTDETGEGIGKDDQVIEPTEVELIRPEPVTEGGSQEITYQVAVKDVPLVEGLVVGQIKVGERLKVKNIEVFNTIQGIARVVQKLQIPPNRVVFDEKFNITLIYGEIRVELGQDDLLEEKISRVAAILPKLLGKSGVLHLEDYEEGVTNIIFAADVPEEITEEDTADQEETGEMTEENTASIE